MLPEIQELNKEAVNFRALLDNCKNDNEMVTEDFPVCNCKLASMIFTYHLFIKWPNIVVDGVSGMAKNHNREETISHYWLEIGDIIIDITADQYNIIKKSELNKAIIKYRPYDSIYVNFKNNTFHYNLFRVSERDKYINGFPTVAEDFIEKMKTGYKQLTEHMICR